MVTGGVDPADEGDGFTDMGGTEFVAVMSALGESVQFEVFSFQEES
jgi:hypothetical protein